MAWRKARSLEVLAAEIESRYPGTTIWFIGDDDHEDEWSDHNPNAAGVVCAGDILRDKGADLRWIADTIIRVNPPALKYVIYQDRIWLPGLGWQTYRGAYHSHVHVSVGWGPDGRSTGPYDDRSPWGIQEDSMSDELKTIKDTVLRIDRRVHGWHLQNEGSERRADGTSYGFRQIRDALTGIEKQSAVLVGRTPATSADLAALGETLRGILTRLDALDAAPVLDAAEVGRAAARELFALLSAGR